MNAPSGGHTTCPSPRSSGRSTDDLHGICRCLSVELLHPIASDQSSSRSLSVSCDVPQILELLPLKCLDLVSPKTNHSTIIAVVPIKEMPATNFDSKLDVLNNTLEVQMKALKDVMAVQLKVQDKKYNLLIGLVSIGITIGLAVGGWLLATGSG